MERQKKLKIGCLFLLCMWAAGAEAATWQMVPDKSQLTFTATQNGAAVTGEFTSFDGTISFDPQTLQDSHVDIIVDMHSLSLSYADLKTMLIASDWFNVAVFPHAEFKAAEFKKIRNIMDNKRKGSLVARS